MASPDDYKRSPWRATPGKPDPGLLKAEISAADLARIRSIDSSDPSIDLDPQSLANILREAETGDATAYLDLAEKMEEKDLHYLGVLSKRKRQVSQLPITVDSASDEKADVRAADFVRDWLQRDTLESELFDVLDAIGKGFSASEIIWNQDGALWFPDRLVWRTPRWFTFDRHNRETPLLKGGYKTKTGGVEGSLEGVPLPPAKFLFHLHPAKSGLPIRGGLARSVAWAYLLKNYALKDWLAFAEIYGRPFRIGKYPAGSTEDQIRTLMRAVAGMGQDAAAVIPEGMSIELVDGKGSGADIFEKLSTYVDRQISKAVLGETATTDADIGGLGSGKEHGDVREDIERADAKLVAASITRDIVTHMVRLNFGPDVGLPKIQIGRAEAWDPAVMVPRVIDLVDRGLRVEASVIADKLGLPDAPKGKDVELLRPANQPGPAADPEKTPAKAPPAPNGPEVPVEAATRFLGASYRSYSRVPGRGSAAERLVAAAALAVAAQEDEIDMAADALVSEHGEQILGALTRPLIDAIAAGASFDEARALLDELAGDMSDDELAALLERACLVSRAAGMSGL